MSNLSDVSNVSNVTSVIHHSGVAVPAAPVAPLRAVKRKTRITIYLDDEVLEAFRSRSEESGKGYQTLINAALRTGLGNAPKLARAD
jgi:uncharacterized protein (DUF4415 family)